MALQQMTDEKKHIFAYLVGSVQHELCSVFTQSKFFLGALKIVPLQTKFEKCRIYLRADPHKQTNLELSFEPSKLKTL